MGGGDGKKNRQKQFCSVRIHYMSNDAEKMNASGSTMR